MEFYDVRAIFETFSGFFFFILFLVIIFLGSFVKKVPLNTVIVIDRNTHYCKTKRHGYYFFNPKTDVVTTKISTNIVTEIYRNVFETHDSCFYELNFAVSYKATDLEMVLSSLQDSRRSIYDVINCAVETVVATFSDQDMNYKTDLNTPIFHQLESMLEPFYIDVTAFKLYTRTKLISEIGEQRKFRKHVSRGDSPIVFE